MLIREIHTGRSINGQHKAILLVNDKEKLGPGALSDLTRFFQEKGLQATPGYDGGHLLRLSGFHSTDALRSLITQEFPAWLKKQHSSPLTGKQVFDDPLVTIPLDLGDKQPFQWQRFMHQYSTPLVGVLSFVSGGAMMGKDIMNFGHDRHNRVARIKSAIGIASTVFFLTASAALTALGLRSVRQPSVTQLLQELEPELKDPNAVDINAKPTLWETIARKINNPWRVATLFNLFGVVIKSVSHSIPEMRVRRNPLTLKTIEQCTVDKMELGAVAVSLASLGLIATAEPERPRNSLLGIPTYDNSKHDPLAQRYQRSTRLFSPFDPANDRGPAGHTNMQIAGYLGMTSNLGFGLKGGLDLVAGYRAQDAVAMKARKSWPLLTLLPLNLAADYLTTISKPRDLYSLDEIATEAANYAASQLKKNASPEEVSRETYILSELLAQHPRVTQSPHELREAIGARLEFDHGYRMPTRGEGLDEYQHLMKVSPFATPQLLSAAATLVPQAQAPQTGFVEKLKQQPQAAILAGPER